MLGPTEKGIGAVRDVELYRAILGLTAPWTVVTVDRDVKGQQVGVRVDAGPGPFPCPVRHAGARGTTASGG